MQDIYTIEHAINAAKLIFVLLKLDLLFYG